MKNLTSLFLCIFILSNLSTFSQDSPLSSLAEIPGGTFIMGDVNGTFTNPHHSNDQIPLHNVSVDDFRMGKTEVKSKWYCDFLNSEILSGTIEVIDSSSHVVKANTDIIYCDVFNADTNTKSLFIWDGSQFSVQDNMEDHPANAIRWEGAVAYCNWLSRTNGYEEIYDLETWEIDYTKSGVRLPTEAEWEYAGRGGDNYREWSWGMDDDTIGVYGNFQGTGDPYEIDSDFPNSAPVGFYDGQNHLEEDFNWPDTTTAYQTSDNSNTYGLQDMSGNSFEWLNDWYSKRYYQDLVDEYGEDTVSNPTGPTEDDASLMPDGIPWRALRSGSWDAGDHYGRISYRKSGYWRGNLDPTYPYFHFGLRIVLDENGSETGSNIIDNSATNTVGLLYYDPSKASTEGYVLYAPKFNKTTYLMNKAGQVLKTWQSDTGPGQKAIISPDGYFYRAGNAKGGLPTIIAHAQAGSFEKQTWDGEQLWEFEYVKDNAISHHDYTVLPNGNFLAMVVEKKTVEECLAVGFLPENLMEDGISLESIIEFSPDSLDEDGVYRSYKIEWEWHLWDHLVLPEFASEHPELYRIGGSGNSLNFNHGNGIEYNEDLNQIALSFRNGDEIIIIEYTGNLQDGEEIASSHSGGQYGKGGDLLYRWGNTAEYGRDDIHLSYSQHDVNWIPEGYPGAGNLVMFNNGSLSGRQYSTVVEIANQWDEVNQSYPEISSSDAHWGPDSLTWEWNADNDFDIFSGDSGGAHRLKNGNTLIAFGIYGLLLEVTPDLEVVWKYKCPVTNKGPLCYNADIHTTSDGSDGRVFKVREYEPDYSGFDGRDLTPIADAIELYDCDCVDDEDNDGVCDEDDQCPNFDDNLIGTACDDGDSCTTGETYDANCGCTGGTSADSDEDGVCDALDQCPNFDDSLIGTACDDGDDCTVGETYDTDCGCSGGTSSDIDNDGVCDVLDQCPDFDDSLIGSACDDGDDCTIGETYDANCGCSGGTSADSDNDGVCDEDDQCPNFDDNLIGTACDDGDSCTTGETYDANCGCTGGTSADSDEDGVCDALDQCPNFDDSLIGTACDDGDDCTVGETYDTDCGCSGGTSSDIDNDGVCDVLDQCPDFDDNLIGSACDDGDDCTTGETYDANCGCSGGISSDSDSDGVCDVLDQCPNFDDNLIGSACNDGDDCTIGETYDANCGCSGGISSDSDSDGVCDVLDQCPNFDDNLIGTACDDGDDCTIGETYDANCGCSGGVFEDNDGDGVCDAEDVCADGDDTVDLDNNGIPDACDIDCTFDLSNFDRRYGIWNDGGQDCRRKRADTSYAVSGTCVRLRDNTSTSVMTTNSLDLSGYNELTVNFSFITESMEDNEDFWLQVSTDDGLNFTTVSDWTGGVDFINSQRVNESVIIPGPFTSTTKLRFRCDASDNNDWVFIDNAEILGCDNSGIIRQNSNSEHINLDQGNNLETLIDVAVYPNPFTNQLYMKLKGLDKDVQADLVMTDIYGKNIIKDDVMIENNLLEITDLKLKPGSYIIQLTIGNTFYSKQVICIN